jgi:hypothetical protein
MVLTTVGPKAEEVTRGGGSLYKDELHGTLAKYQGAQIKGSDGSGT